MLDKPAYAAAAARAADFILHAHAHRRRPAAAAPGAAARAEAERLPGGLRLPARRPGVAVRGDVRAALDRGGAGPGAT